MAWLDNLLNHFALYPAHLFALLFVMALSKSTVLISSVLPPASVMLLTGHYRQPGEHAPGAGVAGRGDGGDGRFDAELPYRPADGAHPAGRRALRRSMPLHFYGFSISCRKTACSPCLRRAFWRCCAISCRWRRVCSGLTRVKVYAVSLLSAAVGRRCMSARSPASAPFELQTSHAAVHQQLRSHRVARLVGGQIERGFCQLRRRAHSAERHQLDDFRHHRVKRFVA